MELWPQPADEAGFFFFCALGVQRDQVRQQRVFAGVGRQAVGLQHGGVQIVVQVFEHADQALGVNGFFFGAQYSFGLGLSKDFQHVVHACQREAGVGGLLAFTVRVDVFGQRGDVLTGLVISF